MNRIKDVFKLLDAVGILDDLADFFLACIIHEF